MSRRPVSALGLQLLLLLCCSVPLFAQNSTLQLQEGSVPLPQNVESFIEGPNLPAQQMVQGHYYRLLHFDRMPNKAERNRLLLSGVRLLEYLPHDTYLAAIPANFIRAELRGYPLRSVIEAPKALRLHPDLQAKDFPAHARSADGIELMVRWHDNLESNQLMQQWQAMGCQVQQRFDQLQLVRLRVPEALIDQLDQWPALAYAEIVPEEGQPEGLGGRTLIRSNVLAHGDRNYSGEGVNAMVFDDGFVGPHVDFTERINQQTVIQGVTSGFNHADMVAGILAGAGNVDPEGIGVAPGVFLHINAYLNSEYSLSAEEWHQDFGVQIFNASYSNGCNAGYTAVARGVDKSLHENPGMMQFYSAGNAGLSNCRYLDEAGWGTITGGHKQAKNAIASANLYPDGSRVESSSRGPAYDGRLKPDLSAHGQGQLSISPNNNYRPGGGTSAASPSNAGVGAQLFEAYQKKFGTEADAALVKVAMMNTAIDLGNRGPDFSFGWGLTHGGRAAEVIEDELFFTAELADGQTDTYLLNIPDGTAEARVMLYWADPPAAERAERALVNDLNLQVVNTTDDILLPLILDHQPELDRITAPATPGVDSINNVEQVRIDNPSPGEHRLVIRGDDIPQGPQKYYLAYYFLKDELNISYPLEGDAMVSGQRELIHWEALGNTDPFSLYFSEDGGNNWSLIADDIDPTARSFEWDAPDLVSAKAKFRLERGNQRFDSPNFHLIGQVQNLSINKACPTENSLVLQWAAVDDATQYEIRRLDGKYMSPFDTVNTAFAELNLDLGQDHWLAVRALGAENLGGRPSLSVHFYPQLITQGCLLPCGESMDIGIRRIITPIAYTTGCLDNLVTVSVELENKGLTPISDAPITYRVDSGDNITETVTATIPAGGSMIYTFETKAEMTEGSHWLLTNVNHPDDGAGCNNSQSLRFTWQEGPQSLPFREDFEGDPLCNDISNCGRSNCVMQNSGWRNLANSVFDYTDWIVSNGGLYRGNFQPGTDHSTRQSSGQFVVLASNEGCVAKDAILQSPCIDLSNAGFPLFESWVYSNGAENGSLYLEISQDEQNWSAVGDPFEQGQSDNWQRWSVNLSAYRNQTIFLRIVGRVSSEVDYNLVLDDIQVYDATKTAEAAFTASARELCPNQPLRLSDLSAGTVAQREWIISPPNYQLAPGSTLSSTNPNLFFTQEGSYTVTLRVTNSAGTSTAQETNYIEVGKGSELPVRVNFEDWELCRKDQICGLACQMSSGWRNATNEDEDEIDWRIISGSPSFSNYGPVVDHTTQQSAGKYLYLEPVSCAGKEALLLSECIDLTTAAEPVLSFWYQIPIIASTELHIDVMADGIWNEDIVEPIVDITPNGWTLQEIDLLAFKGKSIVIRFRGITGTNTFGRISIDDIDIYDKTEAPLPGMLYDNTQSCIAYPLFFQDQSSNNTSSREWRFEPDTYVFVNGTSATDEQVSVRFLQPGTYTAILTASNAAGNREIRQEDLIEIAGGTSLPYYETFTGSSQRSCARSNNCKLTCAPIEGWFNGINGMDDDIDWHIERARLGVSLYPPSDYTTRRVNGEMAYLNYKFGCEGTYNGDLITPCMDLAGTEDVFLTFAYYMGGDAASSLQVDVYRDGVWELEVMPRVTSLNRSWTERTISLKEYAGEMILIRFRGQAGDDYPTYVAIDDVQVYAANNRPEAELEVPPYEECIGTPVYLQNYTKGFVNSWDWRIEPNTYEFVDGTNSTDRLPAVNFLQDGTYNIQLIASNDFFKDTTEQVLTISQGLLLPYENNFESMSICAELPSCSINCILDEGMRNLRSDANDWFVLNSRTFDVNTGPTTDHTLGNSWGRYLFVPSRCPGTDAMVSTPCLDLTSSETAKMTFWYHMFGQTMGNLHVDVAVDGVWSYDVIPAIQGDQGDEWKMQEIDLNQFAGKHITVAFRGEINGSTSDIAIDDIQIQSGTVSNSNLITNDRLVIFPNPTKGRISLEWTQLDVTSLQWSLYDQQGRLLRKGGLPTTGRTTAGIDLGDIPEGMYMLRVASESWIHSAPIQIWK
ncbi:MAG: S8 family serine peptidase [Bacteroidota bacterium]